MSDKKRIVGVNPDSLKPRNTKTVKPVNANNTSEPVRRVCRPGTSKEHWVTHVE